MVVGSGPVDTTQAVVLDTHHHALGARDDGALPHECVGEVQLRDPRFEGPQDRPADDGEDFEVAKASGHGRNAPAAAIVAAAALADRRQAMAATQRLEKVPERSAAVVQQNERVTERDRILPVRAR
jgi:hypothetical protein